MRGSIAAACKRDLDVVMKARYINRSTLLLTTRYLCLLDALTGI